MIYSRRPRPRKDTFVLVGLSHAGKTRIFHQLCHGEAVRTFSSLKENEKRCALHSEVRVGGGGGGGHLSFFHGGLARAHVGPALCQLGDPEVADKAARRPLTLIDLPGNEKQRFRFSDFAAIAGGVVFVIDAAAFAREYAQVADYLYDILSHAKITEHQNPILILCNKCDVSGHAAVADIRKRLEEELYVTRPLSAFHWGWRALWLPRWPINVL